MAQDTGSDYTEKRTHAERLVDIADAIFERATALDSITLAKKNEESQQIIEDARDDGYQGVINVWHVIIDMLPTSGLDQPYRKELEIDGYKVISRCHHRLGDLDAAKQAIIQAIDLGYADGFISLGAINMDSENLDEAEKAFKTALSKDAQVTRAHAGLGEMYFKRGTNALKAGSQKQGAYFFEKSEQEFLAAGKERFAEGYERAMELFETIGWKDQAMAFGEKAIQIYENNRIKYGDRLRQLSPRLRKIAGDERYERFLAGLGRGIGTFVGGSVREKK
jgi:tetratricopeptide (TPR) repeat protein